jgi:asparagine synthase (glutamine-hydrolysing)
MCGIAGIVSLDSVTPVDPERLERMRDALSHRGPDGQGAWLDGPVGLGHRRLAIIDVARGHQPMANEDQSAWITFNGEIYNHRDLRPGLEERGHIFATQCDTETILHLYEERGADCVEALRGMFAFALWDRTARRLLLARDRLGIKPLYYAITDRELLFASEIKSILAAGGVRPEFNEDVLDELLATRFVSGAETCFRGIRKLQPGHTLIWTRETGATERRYWQIPAPGATRGDSVEVAGRDLRERLTAAISRHLMSDVPLGLFLSGGLDSSAIAALTVPLVKEPLQTFAVGFADPEANELPYARLVAEHLGTRHRDILVSPGEYFDALPSMIWQEDEPIAFPSSVPLYFVSALASRHVKVVLTGEGADELFLGYNKYRVTLWNTRFTRAYAAAVPRWLRRQVKGALSYLPAKARRYSDRTFAALDPEVRSIYFDNFSTFPDRLRAQLLNPDLGARRDPFAAGLACYDAADGHLLERLSRVDLQTYLHELLMKQDQMSMAASIESRVPFLDDAVVEHAASLPTSLKTQGWETKAVLRSAVRSLLPPQVLTRRKMGFPVPVGRWLRHRFWPLVEEFVLSPRAAERKWLRPGAVRRMAQEHQAGQINHGDRLWMLVNLEMWQRIFCEGERPADVMRPVRSSLRLSHAYPLAENGRAVARKYRRPAPQLRDSLGAVAAASGRGGDDRRTG